MKNITKTILFASLIAAMILPLYAINAAEAEQITDKSKDDIRKEINKNAHEKLITNIKDKTFRDNVPLVMSYLDENGKVITIVDKDGKESKGVYEQRIKEFVGDDAEIEINMGYFERETCSSRTSDCDPLYGGIKIYAVGSGYSTLTIGATDDDEVKGFVTSSHGVGSGTGQDIKQPTSTSDKIGDVFTNPTLDGRDSDAAFVELDAANGEDPTNEIYRTPSTHYTVTGTSDPGYSTRVQKTGYLSGESDGYVIGTALTVYDPVWGELNDQTAADYSSLSGDSGAPVYSYSESAGNVTLYGIHVGYGCLFDTNPCPEGYKIKVFSPWNNVSSELNLDTIP